MSVEIKVPRKLIEVALPLDAINAAAAREKSIRHGHPSTLHLWWARRPLAAARAVIFSQIVNDPEDLWRYQNPGIEPKPQHKSHWTKRRAELFHIIEEIVKWENTTNEEVLNKAREEIRKAWRETCELNKDHPKAKELFDPAKMPGLHDPFAGGGAIPLEAQRLGLEAYASDLNPVAVLINKAMIEIPPKFAGKPPVHPRTNAATPKITSPDEWRGAKGLAEDVRYYGQWMRDEAFKRIGNLYPPIEVTKEMAKDRPDLEPYVGQKLTVIAWLWARTAKSPNPAFSSVDVPLVSTFILSSKEGKEAYVEPVISKSGYTFSVKVGKPPASAKTGTKASGRGANFICLLSNTPISGDYIKAEGKAGRMGVRLMAIVAEGARGRIYLAPTSQHEAVALQANPAWKPSGNVPARLTGGTCVPYGLKEWGDLFTPRQLVALTTFSDLVGEAREQIHKDAIAAGLLDDDLGIDAGGTGAKAYAEAISLYLAFAIDKVADRGSSLGRWDPTPTQSGIINTFSRQALPMTWDFAESNPLGAASGNFVSATELVAKVASSFPMLKRGNALQLNASEQDLSNRKVISTDPPYYDNIGYADLSDFFYVWLRHSLNSIYPIELSTIAVPKTEELVATPSRHGSRENAEQFFLDGMTKAMHNLAVQTHPAAPITIYYAFKQSETESSEGTSSTGWETFLEAVLKSGLALTGTWPMRTELGNRMISSGTNALASSIVLVCRPRKKNAGTIDRRKFQRLLNEALPAALDAMTRGAEGEHSPVAPVDLSQAIIGPGMAIFSRYDAVLEANGTPMTVKTALQLINRFLAEEDFDTDTQFCLHWFESHKWDAGKFGEADVLARAKGTSVDALKAGGVLESSAGNVRLYQWEELPADWKPEKDERVSVWEILHHLIRKTNSEGERGSGAILAKVPQYAESVRILAYRLYTICERRGWAADATPYNNLVLAWESIDRAAQDIGYVDPQKSFTQKSMFDDDALDTDSKKKKARKKK